jgi:hypothetical protein
MVKEVNKIQVESLIAEINDRFDDIAEIHVAHLPTASEGAQLVITVHTGEVDSFEQFVTVASAEEVTIDVGNADPLSLPYDVITTVDGAGHIQGVEGTTLYMSDDVIGAESRDLETGLSMLRQKLAGMCPFCEAEVDTFGGHYRDSLECQQAEKV